jgi:hypothetical protein
MNITFGKYKDQDLAIVYADKDYKRWLLKQDFFKEKFPEQYEYLKNYKLSRNHDLPKPVQKKEKFIRRRHNYHQGEICECGNKKKSGYWTCYNCYTKPTFGGDSLIYRKWKYDACGCPI